MKKSKKLSIIDLLPAVMGATIFLIVLAFTIFLFNQNPVSAIILSLVGLVLNYVTGIAVHEAGHVIAAKKYKMRLVFVNVGLFSVDYENAKILPFTLFGKNAGKSSFLPTRPVTEKQIRSIAAYGLAFSLAYFIIAVVFSVVVSVLTGHSEPLCVIAAGQAANYYILSFNALSSDKTSDGSLALGNDYSRTVAQVSEIQRQILNGETPTEPDDLSSNNQPIAVYFRYLFALKNEGIKSAKGLLKLLPELDEFSDDEFKLLYPEILYNVCKSGEKNDKTLSYASEFFSDAENTVAVLRAHAAYRRLTGDRDWANTLEKSYEAQLKNAPDFIKEIERALTE